MVAMSAQRILDPVTEPDEVLVARVLRGDDPDAFRRLYLRHARYVASVVTRVMGNDGDLDDIVQDTFIRATERLADLREPARVRRWLATIAVRHCQGRLARRRRRGWLRQQWTYAAAQASDPRDRAPADELYAALDQIPDKLRVPWVLARIDGEKLEDVAAICEVSLATVKRRIAAAQTRLDRRMGGTP
jgi:RNA polymerase sigma-70 factor (ECF subfamily)